MQGSYDETGKINMDLLNDNLKNISGLKYNGQLLTDSGVRIESLPATVEVDGYEVLIGANGVASTVIRIEGEQEETTKPYYPSNDFTKVEGTNLEDGLVITDGTNSWVWIEVPTNIYENTTYNGGTAPTGANDYDAIEKVLKEYTRTYKTGKEDYIDVWYDSQGNTAEDEEANLNDTAGCGLTYEEYNNLKKTMLSSVYRNGGFWIGQYEAGSSVVRKDKNAELTIPVLKDGSYPYNYITCSNAQKQTSKMNSGSYTSSLMFGIQWDLVLKQLEVSGKATADELTKNSKDWGNYSDSTFSVKDGSKYAIYSNWSLGEWSDVPTSYTKPSFSSYGNGVLLSTGASELNKRMNIYDLAGNEYEWTLEKSTYSSIPCTYRGGSYISTGSNVSASFRNDGSTSDSGSNNSFRPALY